MPKHGQIEVTEEILGQCSACGILVGPNFMETQLVDALYMQQPEPGSYGSPPTKPERVEGRLCGRCDRLNTVDYVFITGRKS